VLDADVLVDAVIPPGVLTAVYEVIVNPLSLEDCV
jgi:hypothetical protein